MIDDHPKNLRIFDGEKYIFTQPHNIFITDYQPMVVGENKALNPQYTKDGVHPTGEGYEVMETLIKQAIEKAL